MRSPRSELNRHFKISLNLHHIWSRQLINWQSDGLKNDFKANISPTDFTLKLFYATAVEFKKYANEILKIHRDSVIKVLKNVDKIIKRWSLLY